MIRTGVMPYSLDVALIFRFHLRDKVGRGGVIAACEQEVLPDKDPFSVTYLIEIIRLDNTAAPNSDLSFIRVVI